MDLESNPSHLGRLTASKWELGTALHFPKIVYEDEFYGSDPSRSYNNNITETPKAVLPYMGFIAPLKQNLGIGFAVYSQGGGGGNFENLQRLSQGGKTINEILHTDIPVIGTEKRIQESIMCRFMTVKLTSGIGARFGNLSVGAGIDLVYAFMKLQKTNLDPTGSFRLPESFDYKSDSAYSYGGKIGMSYELTEKIRFAYSYTTANKLPLDGNIQVISGGGFPDQSRVSRFMIWPDRHIAGISYRTSSWILDFDIKYVPWSHGFTSSKFILEHPMLTTPLGTQTNVLQMNLRWRDQWIYSIGGEYSWSDSFRTRIGYSYGRTPLTPQSVSPILGTTTEHHLSAGIGYYLGQYAFHAALEYGFPKSLKGAKNSDWALSHSDFLIKGSEPYRLDFKKSTSVISLYIGIEKQI
ncbi:OmpP1/FadL family transporter [Leptospira perolatii]|uniref:OmpP1/FadL family transporter n=1 Tax=Leptospira perolatii TaxID=2023191 RepID=UPI001FAF2B43|nr:outer membrane protein transport protein [Leptospira perolatii]